MVTPLLSRILLDLIFILLGAKAGGWLAEKIGQPSVLGEILAGIIIGPSVFGLVNPLVAEESAHFSFEFLLILGEIGAMVLLFQVGLESSLYKLMKSGINSLAVATIGVVTPFMFGFLYFYGVLGQSFNVAVFVGGTLTATSVGITMRILSDMGKMKSEEGRIILGAAVIDDVMGLIVLSMVIGLVGTAVVTPGQIIMNIAQITLIAVVFLLGSLWIGIRFMPRFLGFWQKFRTRRTFIISSFIFLLAYGYLADMVGLAAIVGAFAAGLVFETLKEKEHFEEKIKPVANLLVPIFFVMVGIRMDVMSLANLSILPLVGVLFAVAVVGKMASGIGVVRSKASKLAVGVGMIPRGEVGLIFVAFGLKAALIDMSLYSALVLVIMLTTLLTPPFFARVMKKVKSEEGKKGWPGFLTHQ